MIYINLEKNSIDTIKSVFIEEEVYSDTAVIMGDKIGYIKNANSGGEVFYYISGTLKDKTIYLKNGKIDLGY